MNFTVEPGVTINDIDTCCALNSSFFKMMYKHIENIGMSKFLNKVRVFNLTGEIYIDYFNEDGIGFSENIELFSEILKKHFPKESMKLEMWKCLHGG